MTRDDAKKIVMFISGSYPNFKPLDLTETVNAWATVFSNFDVEQVKLLVKSYIMSDESGFPPSIGQIVNVFKKQEKRKYFEELEKMLLETSYSGQIEDKRQNAIKSLNQRKESEIRVLEEKIRGVPMLDRCKERMEEMRNETS